MSTTEVRPWRLVLLFSGVFMLTAYMPHPNLEKSLPESIGNWLQGDPDKTVMHSEV